MLIRQTKSIRIYAAGVLTLVYLSVVVLPAFASTFGGDAPEAGCLTHTVTGTPSGASDVAANDRDVAWQTDQSDETPSARCGTCCGLSCGCYGLSCDFALAGRSFSDASSHMSLQVIARLQPDLERRDTVFIDRPPKVLISL